MIETPVVLLILSRIWCSSGHAAPTPLDRINMLMHDGGLQLWFHDVESLTNVVRDAGFLQIAETAPCVSPCPAMSCLDHPDREFESIYIEGGKIQGPTEDTAPRRHVLKSTYV